MKLCLIFGLGLTGCFVACGGTAENSRDSRGIADDPGNREIGDIGDGESGDGDSGDGDGDSGDGDGDSGDGDSGDGDGDTNGPNTQITECERLFGSNEEELATCLTLVEDPLMLAGDVCWLYEGEEKRDCLVRISVPSEEDRLFCEKFEGDLRESCLGQYGVPDAVFSGTCNSPSSFCYDETDGTFTLVEITDSSLRLSFEATSADDLGCYKPLDYFQTLDGWALELYLPHCVADLKVGDQVTNYLETWGQGHCAPPTNEHLLSAFCALE